MTLRAWVFCLPAAAVASTYSGHTARTVGLRPAASPPLLLFLRKVLLLLSSWTKICNQIRGSTQAWDLDFRNLQQFISLCFSFGEKVRRRQMPPRSSLVNVSTGVTSSSVSSLWPSASLGRWLEIDPGSVHLEHPRFSVWGALSGQTPEVSI